MPIVTGRDIGFQIGISGFTYILNGSFSFLVQNYTQEKVLHDLHIHVEKILDLVVIR